MGSGRRREDIERFLDVTWPEYPRKLRGSKNSCKDEYKNLVALQHHCITMVKTVADDDDDEQKAFVNVHKALLSAIRELLTYKDEMVILERNFRGAQAAHKRKLHREAENYRRRTEAALARQHEEGVAQGVPVVTGSISS